MSLTFEKNSKPNLLSKTNYLIICTLTFMTHGVLVYNWLMTRNMYNLIFMVIGGVFAITAIIPMIKEYYTKVRLVNDKKLMELEVERLKSEVKELKDSKKAMQLKLSEEMSLTDEQSDRISHFEQQALQFANIIDDLQAQLVLFKDTHTGVEDIAQQINELRERGLDFIAGLDSGTKEDEEQFHATFNNFMNEFKDMKDLIFQLKTLSFRVDVQASLLNDSEMAQSSGELEGLSRNLAKFYNTIIALLANLEGDFDKTKKELQNRLETCAHEITDYTDCQQDLSAELTEYSEQLGVVYDCVQNKLTISNELFEEIPTEMSQELDEEVDSFDVFIEENTVISATNPSVSTDAFIQ